MIIFYLYSGSRTIKSFKTLSCAMTYIKDNEHDNLELYAEEYDDDNIMSHGIRTLIYKSNNFQIKRIFDYY